MCLSMRLFYILLFVLLSVRVYGADESDFWSSVPTAVGARYRLAESEKDKEWVLAFADTLENMSNVYDEYNCHFYASYLRATYAFYKKDSLAFFRNNNKAIECSKQCGYTSRYYNLMLNSVSFYVNMSHVRPAQLAARELLNEARRNGDMFGLRCGYTATAMIWKEKQNYKRATENYLKALDCAEKTRASNKSKANLCAYLSECYFELRDYKKAEMFARKGLDLYPKYSLLLAMLVKIYYFCDDKDNFRATYNDFKGTEDKNTATYNLYVGRVEAMNSAINGDFHDAIERVSTVEKTSIRYKYIIEFYCRMNDWKRAYDLRDKLEAYNDSVSSVMYDDELAEMNSEIDAMYQIKKKDEVVLRQRAYMVLSSVLFLMVLSCGLLVYARYVAIKKKNKALADSIDKYVKSKEQVLRLEQEKYAGKSDSQDDTGEPLPDADNADERNEEKGDHDDSLKEDTSASDNPAITRFIYEITSRKLFTDQNFNREKLLDELHIQKRTFSKDFETQTGTTYKEYITDLRLEYAVTLMREHPEYTIEAIAMECGINSYVTFHRNFTRHFGITPSAYRNQQINS